MKTITFCLFFAILISGFVQSQWVQTAGTPEGGGITDMVVTSNGTIVVTCAGFNFPNGQFGGIRHSTNNGATWVNDYQHYTARTLALGQNGYVWASSWDYPSISEALWVSFNQGAVWQGHTYLIGSNNNIFCILVRDNNQTVYIGTRTGVRKSTNGGSTFTPVNNGIPANSRVRDIEADSAGVLAAATTNGLFISTNNASSWIQATGIQAGDTIMSLMFYDNYSVSLSGKQSILLAGTTNGRVYKSDESGYAICILMLIMGDDQISDMASEYLGKPNEEEAVAVITYPVNNTSMGFSLSTNSGLNFSQFNGGLPQLAALSAMAFGAFNTGILIMYLGIDLRQPGGARVYHWEMVIGIHQISSEVPDAFSLSQNYPNPFNPLTKIRFTIPKTQTQNIKPVQLKVYDILGRELKSLVNESLKPGTYETDWNAENEAGGVYFYRLEADGYSETKKMILVK